MNNFRKNPYRRNSLWQNLLLICWWPVSFIPWLLHLCLFRFISLFSNFNRFFVWMGNQLKIWIATREYRYLLKGLPAILLVGFVIYVIGISVSNSKELLIDGYLQKAKKAQDSNNPQLASMLYERVIQMQGESDPTLYNLAINLGKEGQIERANYIFDLLAPEKESRYGPAHYLKAQSILGSPQNLDPIKYQLAKRHLQLAYNSNRFDHETCFTLAELYFGEGDIPNAQKYYAEIEKEFPAARLQLAKTYTLTNNTEKARELAISAKEDMERLGVKDKNDIRYVLVYADILTYLEEYQEAINQITRIYMSDPKTELRDAIIQIKVNWADSLLLKNPNDRRPSFLILTDVLKFHSDNLLVFDRLMKVMGNQDEISQEARQMLLDCVTQGIALDMAHVLLGTDAGDRGDFEQAIFHLNRALEISPKSMIIINNLAWYLAIKKEPELPRAFELIDAILTQTKTPIAQLYDTRGMINLKMGKFNSALQDLERALPQLETNAGIHERLAETYEKLGIKELSEKHKLRAEALNENKKRNN